MQYQAIFQIFKKSGRNFGMLKCLPPIRDEENLELLWDGIREGVINQVEFKN